MAKQTTEVPQTPEQQVADLTLTDPTPTKTFESFSVARAPGGWVFLKSSIEVNADGQARVVGVEMSEPDVKAIILEKFKISAFNYWSKL